MTQAVAQVRNVVQRSGFANPLTLGVLVTTASYVKVYADDELLVSGADYELAGVGEADGVSIEIIGADDPDNYVGYETFTALYDPPLDQQVDLSSGGRLGASYEAGLDQANRRLQALADPVSRSLRLPPNMDVDGELPWPPGDGEVPIWDEATQRVIWGGPAGAAAASAAAAAASAAEAATAETNAETAETNAEAAQAAALAAQAAAEAAASAFPPGGADGQVLTKQSAADYDTVWEDAAATDGSFNVRSYGATGDGTTDDTAEIQAAIDAGGSNSTVVVPAGTYRADGLRLDGSGGTLTGVTLVLMAGARIRARAAAVNNVIEAVTGSGHKIRGPGRISGSKDTGGAPVRSPTKGFWATGVSYSIGDTVEVSSTDVATTTIAASNLVYVATANHTAGATFLGDKATKWSLSAAANYNTADLSYRYRNGVYFGNCTDIVIDGVEIDQCVYAAINLGSGPVQAANIGGAAQRGLVTGNYIHTCENGIAGGRWQVMQVLANQFRDLDIYGIVADIDANENVIADNELIGKASALHAIFMYDAEHNTIANNKIIALWTNGIVVDAGANYTTVIGNTVTQVTNVGIFIRSSLLPVCNNNAAFNCVSGIQLVTLNHFQANDNQCFANTADGLYINTCYAGAVQGNQANGNGASGIRLGTCTDLTVTGNIAADNVTAGIRGTDSLRVVANGNSCYDTRSGGSKTQARGVLTDGTCDYWCVMGNMLVGNLTSATSMVGTHNLYVAANDNGMGLGVEPTAGDGLLQLASGTTKAAGIAFANDTYLFRAAAGYLRQVHASDSAFQVLSGAVVSSLRATAAGVALVGTTTNHAFALRTNDLDRVSISAAGDVTAKQKLLADNPTGGVGYAAGAGGAVAQATSKSTGVTLSKVTGQITMNNAALAAGTIVSFVLTNTAIAAGDVLVLNHVSGGTMGAYTLNARCGAGSATIDVRNNTAGSLSEAVVIGFTLIKGATA